ncbi:hypothetical protein GCM10009789_61250 [Kribbella sancticallisti]|uniref:Uncharacterized protein n=1 Tax=Kribbella sancticallisti TaxID=460087 RepID=A0ABN2EBP3_9ACTN
MNLRPENAESDRLIGDDLTDAVLTVEDNQGAGVADGFHLGDSPGRPAAEPRDVPGQAEQTVGCVAPELGRDESVGQEVSVGCGDAFGAQYGLGEAQEGSRARPLDGVRR